jgi:hypothetical protein
MDMKRLNNLFEEIWGRGALPIHVSIFTTDGRRGKVVPSKAHKYIPGPISDRISGHFQGYFKSTHKWKITNQFGEN